MKGLTKTYMSAAAFSLLAAFTIPVVAETPSFPFPGLFEEGELFPLPVPAIDTGKIVEEALKAKAEALANPEISAQFAKFVRQYYEALLDEGFTSQEALEIVTATGIPTVQ